MEEPMEDIPEGKLTEEHALIGAVAEYLVDRFLASLKSIHVSVEFLFRDVENGEENQ
jgi:phenylpyruvate tautomerase PptA (4-oxalocrotonate tautomerase family)